jgi:DNA-binding FadR family transcriptional regulator
VIFKVFQIASRRDMQTQTFEVLQALDKCQRMCIETSAHSHAAQNQKQELSEIIQATMLRFRLNLKCREANFVWSVAVHNRIQRNAFARFAKRCRYRRDDE